MNAIHRSVSVALVAGVAVLPGCGGQKQGLRPHMLDTEYNAALDQNFKTGMSGAEVEGRLDALGIAAKHRHWYTGVDYAGHGPQLLARVYEPGGMWIDQDDQTIEWVDTWFVFEPSTCTDPLREGRLTRWYIHRGNQRYFEGEPVYAPPANETLGPTLRYPFPPPLPARPPQ